MSQNAQAHRAHPAHPAHCPHVPARRKGALTWALTLSLSALVAACAAGPRLQTTAAIQSESAGDASNAGAEPATPHDARLAAVEEASAKEPSREGADMVSIAGGAAPTARPSTQEESRAVARPELQRFLDQGIPATLQQIPVQPIFSKGHLLGYQVISFFADRPDVAQRAGIRPGDVITRVNGQPVARPEDLWSVWEGLRRADRFTVEVLRDGQPLHLTWKVEDSPQPGL